MTNPALRALEGKWVRLVVDAFEYQVTEVTTAEADAWWDAHRPPVVTLPALDLTVTDLRDIEKVVVEGTVPLRDAISKAVQAFGAKAAGYSVLANTPGIPARKAFGIPAYYYVQFMQQNGFFARVDAMLADPEFRDKAVVRDNALAQLRAEILGFPVPAATTRTPGRRSRATRISSGPCARPGRRSGSSGPSRSAATTASTTRAWAWRSWSTTTSPARPPTGWR